MAAVSFIVIGKNQEKTIYDCINSIYALIEENNLKDSEVIFVDSDSTDKTVEIITNNFTIDKIIKISGDLNAATARNAGAKHANGCFLFFIDGDMILDPSFIKHIYNDLEGFKYDFISGELEEILYNDAWKPVGHIEKRYGSSESKKSIMELGGIFIIKADQFRSVNGFKEYMRLNEDHDLEIRLANRKLFLTRLKYRIATHHCINRFTYRVLLQSLVKGNFLFFGVTYRENFFNSYCIKRFFRMQKYAISFIILCLLSILINPLFLGIYFLIAVLRNLKVKDSKSSGVRFLLGRLALDVSLILGFIAFYPSVVRRKYKETIL